jgi:hypothetical protein
VLSIGPNFIKIDREMAQRKKITPPATEKSLLSRDTSERTRQPKNFASIEELGKAAQETLHYINSNKERLGDKFIIGFVNRVREFAQTANGNTSDALASFRKGPYSRHQDISKSELIVHRILEQLRIDQSARNGRNVYNILCRRLLHVMLIVAKSAL